MRIELPECVQQVRGPHVRAPHVGLPMFKTGVLPMFKIHGVLTS
jgi:hypothetical protein